MKSISVSIAIVLGLILLFFFIDRKEFRRHDDVQTFQKGSKETSISMGLNSVSETKRIIMKKNTFETEPDIYVKPVVEMKTPENKPTVETLPVTTTDIETKPTIEESSGNESVVVAPEPVPTAVPVVSPKEAEKLNAEAIIAKREFEERKTDKTILEGEIIVLTDCPDPTSIDYPDCNLSATVLLNDVAHTQICLIIPCIRNSKVIFPDTIKVNSLIAFKILDEDTLSEDEKSIQLVEDNPNFELDYCYSSNVQSISGYSKRSRYIKKAPKEIVYDPNLVLTEKDIVVRKEYMSKELERLTQIISNYSASDAKEFCDSFSEIIRDKDGKHPYAEIECDDGTIIIYPFDAYTPVEQFLDNSFSNNQEVMIHNAEVIASVNKYLNERGILFYVVPVPLPFEAYADRLHLSKELSTYNINRIMFMQQLLMRGVETIDLEPMIEENIMQPFLFFRLLIKDIHPSEIGAYYIAEYICKHLNRYQFFPGLVKNDYSIEVMPTKQEVSYYGESFNDMDAISLVKDVSPVNKQSPFLLVGDSFTWYSHIQNYFSNFIKTKINVISRGSSFPITAQLIQMRSSEISPNTKVCFLVGTSLNIGSWFPPFYETGIQIYPSDKIQNPDLYMECEKDLFKNTCSFDLVLPESLDLDKRYRLVVFTYSNEKNIEFQITINDQTRKVKGDYSNNVFYMPRLSSPLRIECSASPSEKYIKNVDATFQINKIMIIED